MKAHVGKAQWRGGPTCAGDLKDYLAEETTANGGRRVQLRLPNSFAMGDGVACGAECEDASAEVAVEEVCKRVLINLILRDAANHPANQVSDIDFLFTGPG